VVASALRELDEFLPDYELSERHSIRLHAPPERIDAAVRSLAVEDVPVAYALFRLRALGRRTPERRPFVDNARRLDDAPGAGVVLGLSGEFWRLRPSRSDACIAVFDFRIDGDRLSTETRVHVADPAARRKFARYWRVIRPFSGLTRILFLREVRRRAEAHA
jgi:hypothetical protein